MSRLLNSLYIIESRSLERKIRREGKYHDMIDTIGGYGG